MGKIAFVFAGQGAQYTGMGQELSRVSLAAKSVFEMADAIRPGTSAQCFNGEKEVLLDTKNTQPCLFCVDLAAARALAERGVRPDALAGFSLGEIPALCFAGAMRDRDGFRLVCRRGELMQRASEASGSGMMAVLRLSDADAESLCRKYSHVYPANYNGPGQLVAAGLKSELALLAADVKAAGGRALLLPVSGGFHSPFMEPAAKGLADTLRDIAFSAPEIPVYANATALPYGEPAAELLVKQVTSPVRWRETVENMIRDGVDTFIEAGPGKTLCGLIAKINGDVRVFGVENAETLEKAVSEVKGSA